MAFPTSDQNTNASPGEAVADLLRTGRVVRQQAKSLYDACQAGSLDLPTVVRSFATGNLWQLKRKLTLYGSMAGFYVALAQTRPDYYASAAEAETGLNTLKAAVQGVIDFVEANIPKDAQGRLLIETFSTDGSATITPVVLTNAGARAAFAAALAPLRDAFDA